MGRSPRARQVEPFLRRGGLRQAQAAGPVEYQLPVRRAVRGGAGPNDEAMQKALIFVSRCQNLESEHNTLPWAAKNPDGGFYYTAAAGGESPAGKTPDGGLRSYGSMTYAGLKSMIYAGVARDDPRVKAAVHWIEQHYDVSANPGMGPPACTHYHHLFAKALDAAGLPEVVDAAGKKHDWRRTWPANC